MAMYERAITKYDHYHFAGICDFISEAQYNNIKNTFEDPFGLLDHVENLIRKRKFVDPIVFPYKYILAVANREKWPRKQ